MLLIHFIDSLMKNFNLQTFVKSNVAFVVPFEFLAHGCYGIYL